MSAKWKQKINSLNSKALTGYARKNKAKEEVQYIETNLLTNTNMFTDHWMDNFAFVKVGFTIVTVV